MRSNQAGRVAISMPPIESMGTLRTNRSAVTVFGIAFRILAASGAEPVPQNRELPHSAHRADLHFRQAFRNGDTMSRSRRRAGCPIYGTWSVLARCGAIAIPRQAPCYISSHDGSARSNVIRTEEDDVSLINERPAPRQGGWPLFRQPNPRTSMRDRVARLTAHRKASCGEHA